MVKNRKGRFARPLFRNIGRSSKDWASTIKVRLAAIPKLARRSVRKRAAELSAGIRASLETGGQRNGPYDVLIAGIALADNRCWSPTIRGNSGGSSTLKSKI